ncbi:MAG: acyltransferase [Bacteroidales bacterium]|nr:acyltransferase [Bacteroidales bacterium]
MPDANTYWTGKTDGTPLMQRSLVWLLRWMPLRVVYAVMALVVPFYMLFNRQAYRAIRSFYATRLGKGAMGSVAAVYRNYFTFGQVVVDRFAAFAGRSFLFNNDGVELFNAMAAEPDGFVVLSSHTGCYEMAGFTLVADPKPMNALVYAGETATVMENRRRILSAHHINMVTATADMSHIFTLSNALADGEIVSLPADRCYGSNKTVQCRFLGTDAEFPLGPFALAKSRQAKMLAIFVMKQSTHIYNVIVRPVDNPQHYADTLQQVVQQYPYQWFNHYDFFNTTQ